MATEEEMNAVFEHPDMAECPECESSEYMAKAMLDTQRVVICSSCQKYWPLDQAIELIPESEDDEA